MLFFILFLTTFSKSCSGLLLTKASSIWQYKDKDKVIYPYCTKPLLDYLDGIDTKEISSWHIFEWGSGSSTIWFAKKCKHITSVEHNTDWIEAINKHASQLKLTNINLIQKDITPPKSIPHDILGVLFENTLTEGGYNSDYVMAINKDNTKYDCIFIDGYHRHACLEQALNHIKPGGIIILNNVNQKTLGIDSTKALEMLKKYEHHSFKQPNHLDWRTDYWIIK